MSRDVFWVKKRTERAYGMRLLSFSACVLREAGYLLRYSFDIKRVPYSDICLMLRCLFVAISIFV